MKLPLSAAFFDFDGVILESVDVKTKAFRQMYDQRAPHVAAEVEAFHLANGGMSRFDKFRIWEEELLGRGPLTDEQMSDLCEEFSALVFDGVCASPFVHGALELLEQLSGSTPIFVVSATPHDEIQQIVARVGLDAFVRSAHGSPTTKGEWIQGLLRDGGFSPKRCIMVGDARADQDAAVANLVPFVGRRRVGETVPFDPDLCVAVVDDMAGLAAFLIG